MGQTDFTEDEVRNLVEGMGDDFRGDLYHLMNKNCNHFTGELGKVCMFVKKGFGGKWKLRFFDSTEDYI